MQRRLVIGSRGSPLALTQARNAQTALCAAAGAPFNRANEFFPIEIVQTSGDRDRETPLTEIGGKGAFTKEIDDWLLGGAIDVAVHSLKDVPGRLPDGIVHGGVLVREDPRDAFICKTASSLAQLPAGASVGTSSPRRKAQILMQRQDLDVKLLRGNVHNRLRAVTTGEMDATFLAAAGLIRLGKQSHIAEIVAPEVMLPAPCQGVIALQCLAENDRAQELCAKADDAETARIAAAERGFVEGIDGSCHSAVAALAEPLDGAVRLRAEALAPDGSRAWTRDVQIDLGADAIKDAHSGGLAIGEALREEAGDALMLTA